MFYNIILLFLFITTSISTNSIFYGHFESDKIIYTSVLIPRYATLMDLTIFTSYSKSKPYALLKYNGVPSIDDYDEKIQLSSRLNLKITDFNPVESQLFIGIWGGVLLHSYRCILVST